MQFPYRMAWVLGLIVFVIFIQGFWKTTEEEDQGSKILRLLATLETHVSEYLSEIRSLRSEIALLRDDGSETESSHLIDSKLIRESTSVTSTRESSSLLASSFYPRLNNVNSNNNGHSSSSGFLRTLLSKNRLKLVNLYNALPHLLDSEDALTPALTIGRQRDGVSVVLGIPTVKRPTQSYLLPTLQNLLNSMLPHEKNDTLIIVFVAEADVSFVQSTVSSITRQFHRDVETGLIEIVAPSGSYYPDFKSIKATLGDSEERTKWRTKQNLDYAYLMMYAQNRGTYYVQLEDDVLSKKGFISTMKNFAITNSVKGDDWFMLDFCQLGFIGKLFRGSDLWKLVEFILLFYQDKPGDWLLSHFFSVKYCKLDYNHKRCLRELSKRWVRNKPSLFQHIGMVSSLNGKVQKLKDRQFGKLELFTKHDNPEARVESTIKHYGRFSLEKAYHGKTYFWGLAPEAGDTIAFYFPSPINLNSYRFVSGNAEHPSDKLYNATLEVQPDKIPSFSQSHDVFPSKDKDGFLLIDEFDDLGMLDKKVPPYLNPLRAVRITLKNPSENWVILSEIYLEKG